MDNEYTFDDQNFFLHLIVLISILCAITLIIIFFIKIFIYIYTLIEYNYLKKNSNDIDIELQQIHSNCVICLDRLNNNLLITQCNHLFHKKCILKWKSNCESNFTCPICRCNITQLNTIKI